MSSVWQSMASFVRARLASRRFSLRTNLVALVVVAVFPLLAFTLALVARSVDAGRADIDAGLEASAKDLATAADRQFETAIAALEALAQSRSLDERDLAAFYTLAGTVRQQRGWGTVVLVDADGAQLLNLLRPLGTVLPNVAGRAYLQEALSTRRPVVSDLYRGSVTGEWVVAVAVPVVRGDTVRRVVVAIIYANELQSLVPPAGRDWTRALVDRSGTIAARTGAPDFIGRTATSDFLQRVSTSRRGTYSTTAVDGLNRYGAFAHAPLSGWVAAVAVPAASVEGALWHSLATPALGGAAVLLLAVALAWALGRRIAAGMSFATSAAEALAQGRRTAIGDSRIAEVSRLAAALQTSGLLLEQRDRERTQALALEADARREAEAASAAKDRFLAMLSHELRTPLAPVVTALGLLEHQETLSARGRDYLALIHRNVQIEAQLIDDLLDVTRIARGKLHFERRRVELCAIVDRALEVCRSDFEARSIDVAVDYGPRPYIIEADAARLQQVFWNVLKNAIKFTPDGGCIAVRARSDDGCARVEVMDSGVGIAPDDLERIFDPFAQVERPGSSRFGGLGLGLAIAKALVQAHGGTIRASSGGAGRGATFTVRLPVIAQGALHEPPPEPAGSALAPAHGSRSLRVLLVEDHPETAEVTRLLLEAAGHRVTNAGDVRSGLDLACSREFDVLVSDLGLPDGSGVDLMRGLRARGNMVPGIAVSGYGSARDIESTRAAGFGAHLVKPVEPERLLRALQELQPAGASPRAVRA